MAVRDEAASPTSDAAARDYIRAAHATHLGEKGPWGLGLEHRCLSEPLRRALELAVHRLAVLAIHCASAVSQAHLCYRSSMCSA